MHILLTISNPLAFCFYLISNGDVYQEDGIECECPAPASESPVIATSPAGPATLQQDVVAPDVVHVQGVEPVPVESKVSDAAGTEPTLSDEQSQQVEPIEPELSSEPKKKQEPEPAEPEGS